MKVERFVPKLCFVLDFHKSAPGGNPKAPIQLPNPRI